MSTDATSLARLHDIVVPGPAPWWPPAPGWLWLLGAASIVAVVALARRFVRRQRNRYRREALAELARLESAPADADRVGAVLSGMWTLLKRAALTAYARERVAALTGPEWFEFLDRTGGTRFADGLGAAMERAIYRPGAPDRPPVDASAMAGEIRAWIRNHEPC